MHVTARVAGQEEVDVEVGEACRTIQALKEAVVVALPQLRVEGFDVSVGGRALADEGVVSLEHGACLDVVPDTRGLAVEALREAGREVSEAGREVSEAGLLDAARDGDDGLCTLYLDAGVPIDCQNYCGWTPLHISCYYGRLSLATLLLDRGSGAIDAKDRYDYTPLHHSCSNGHLSLATLLLDRGCDVDVEAHRTHHERSGAYTEAILELLLSRGHDVRPRSLCARIWSRIRG